MEDSLLSILTRTGFFQSQRAREVENTDNSDMDLINKQKKEIEKHDIYEEIYQSRDYTFRPFKPKRKHSTSESSHDPTSLIIPQKSHVPRTHHGHLHHPFATPIDRQSLVHRVVSRQALGGFTPAQKAGIAVRFLPTEFVGMVGRNCARVFCGSFSKDGSTYMSASQDGAIKFYSYPDFSLVRTVNASNIGWAIIDTDYSPDQNFLIYSCWSPYVYLCNVNKNTFETHQALKIVQEDYADHFCLFSIKFSSDSREIIGGSNDHHLYMYDIENGQSDRVFAHKQDVNAVAFADDSSFVIFTGSDDRLCKVWDRRENMKRPSGVLIGHTEGITSISSKEDGRYFISNSKDNSIKLWDLRKMAPSNTRPPPDTHYDYRMGQKIDKNQMTDYSLMTYTGHKVEKTLIRAKISPKFSTGQSYIYSGSADGRVHIWDLLTGELTKLPLHHRSIVRDVSWHPYEPCLMSGSWDDCVGLWKPQREILDPENII